MIGVNHMAEEQNCDQALGAMRPPGAAAVNGRVRNRALRSAMLAMALLSGAAQLAGQTFNYSGSLADPNKVFQIVFTLNSPANVTIKTTSWQAGNFDPVVWLFDADTNQIQKNDDSCNGVGCSPISRDSLIQVQSLAAGTYTVYLSAYDQHFWRAGAAGNPPGVLVTGWSYQGDFAGLPSNYAMTLTTSVNIATPYTALIFPPSDVGPAAPTLISPAKGATGISATPAFSWNAVSGTNGYAVYWGTTNPPTVSTITNNTALVPGTALSPGTTYYWKVSSRDPARSNTESPSLTWSFTTAAGPLPAPTLVSPASGATGVVTTPALSWSAVTGSAGYTVYLGTTNPPTLGTQTTGSPFTPPTPLTPGTTYYWKVASRDPNNGNAEVPSIAWSFTTANPLPAPALVSPASGATGVPVTTSLSWNAVSGSAGYTVYLGTTNPPTTGTQAAGSPFTPSTPLTPGTTYYWKVASRDPNNNNAESASSVWSFGTASPPLPAPALVSPANGAAGVATTPALSWNAVTGSAGYSVYLGTTNPPTTGTQAAGSPFAPSTPLTPGTTYYWKVSSRDPNNGNAEAPSVVWSFTTANPLPAPVLVSPASGATGVPVTTSLNWNAVIGSAGYTVYLGTTNPPTAGTQIASSPFTPTAALSPGTTYYWKVSSRDPNNSNAEAPSAVWSFTTANPLPAPGLVSPASGATGVPVTTSLSWNAVTGSAGYTVYLGTTNPPTVGTQTASSPFTPSTPLTPGTTYYWKVASRDPNNNNAESASSVWSFGTASPPLPAPTLVSPANGAAGVATTPALSWNAVTGSAGYTVYLGTTNPPTTGTQAAGSSFTPSTPLTPGTTYYWKVASRDPNNNNAEAPSAIWSFTTATPLPAPALVSPASGATGVPVTTSLSWNAVTGSAGYTVYLGTTNPPTTGTQTAGSPFTPAAALSPGTTYYWKVASRDPNNNNAESPSAVWSFRTASPPLPAPALVSPSSGATGVPITTSLSWNVVSGSAGYLVYLGTTNPPTTATQATSSPFTPAAALTPGTTYYWKVSSLDPNNNNSEAPSAIWSFTTNATPPNGYSYRRTITIDHTKVPNTDQTDFPFLFNTTDPLLRIVASGGHVSNLKAYDVIFTADAAGSQKLDHQIEFYAATTGQFTAWVRIPALSHLNDTVIYMFYGNSSVTTSQENKAGLWNSSYRAVYHMSDNAATQTVTDSTSLHPGTNIANTNTKSVAGQADGALTFDGSSDYVTAANAADLQSNAVKTVSFWMKASDLSGAITERILCEYTNSSNYWSVVSETAGNADFNTLRADMKVNNVDTHLKIADNSITAGVFYFVAVVFNNSVPSAIYLNGTSLPLLTPKQGGLGYGTKVSLTIGARNDGARNFPGVIDEVRISSAVRTSDWIRTEYNNQSNPSAFYTMSGE